jgi:hypothetical protein
MELEDRMLTEIEVARRLSLTVSCLRRWRAESRGPAFRRLGRRIRYSGRSVALWVESQPSGGSAQSQSIHNGGHNAE